MEKLPPGRLNRRIGSQPTSRFPHWFHLSLVVATIIVLSAGCVSAQWKQLDVGQSGLVHAVTVVGRNLFAGAQTGIYRSYDYGTTWRHVSNSIAYSFATEGSEILAGTYRDGILRSTDGGFTWTRTDTSFDRWIMALATKDTVMFAGGAGMFRSTDDGASWKAIENGLGSYTGLTITGLAVDGSKLFATSSAGLFMSSDDGDSWSHLQSNALPSEEINCIAVRNSVIIVGTAEGIVTSTDDGQSWSQDNAGLPMTGGVYTPVYSLAVDGNQILAGTNTGIFVYPDSGTTWNAEDDGFPQNQVRSIAAMGTSAGTFLFAGTNISGVYISVNNGASWFPTSGGISTSLSTAYSVCGYGSFVCAVLRSGMYSSTDNGTTWTPDTNLPDWGTVFSMTTIDSSVYAMTDSGIFVSSDSARTWSLLSSIAPTYPIVKAGPNLVAFQNNGIYYSADGGRNWNLAGNTPFGAGPLAVSGSNVIAAADSGVYLSNDDGQEWARSDSGPANITSLAAEGSDVIAGRFTAAYTTGMTPGPPGGLFLSADNGQTWLSSISGFPEYRYPQVVAVAIHGQRVFAGLEPGSATFYASTLGEHTWQNKSSGLPFLLIRTIYVNDSSVFVGEEDDGGIWRAPLSDVTGIMQPTPQSEPSSFALSQNYPNPFNPTTKINYSISGRSHVTIMIYNVLGEKVETLVNAFQQAGNHTVSFNASRLASGVYFYRLEANGKAITKKLLFLK